MVQKCPEIELQGIGMSYTMKSIFWIENKKTPGWAWTNAPPLIPGWGWELFACGVGIFQKSGWSCHCRVGSIFLGQSLRCYLLFTNMKMVVSLLWVSNWLSGNYNLHIELFVINEGVTPVAALCPSERLLFHANMPVYPRVGLKH